MKKFKCLDCKHSWQIIFGAATPGSIYACPKCRSLRVQRTDRKDGHVRKGTGKRLWDDANTVPDTKPEPRKPS